MKQLQFKEPIVATGLNVTVRRLPKWKDIYDKHAWDNGPLAVEVTDVNGRCRAAAKIVTVRRVAFLDIPETWLALEHDPSCTNLKGLLVAMQAAYPDFDVNEPVDVVFFEV